MKTLTKSQTLKNEVESKLNRAEEVYGERKYTLAGGSALIKAKQISKLGYTVSESNNRFTISEIMTNLKKYLKKNNLRAYKIAQELGINRGTFESYTRDSSRISGKNAKKILAYFTDIDYNFIYDYDEKN